MYICIGVFMYACVYRKKNDCFFKWDKVYIIYPTGYVYRNVAEIIFSRISLGKINCFFLPHFIFVRCFMH